MRFYIFTAAVLVLSFVFTVKSQNPDPSQSSPGTVIPTKVKDFTVAVTYAEMNCNVHYSTITVMLSHSLKESPKNINEFYQLGENYHVIDLNSGKKYQITGLRISTALQNTVSFDTTEPILDQIPTDKMNFALVSKGLKLVDGSDKSNPSMTEIVLSDSCVNIAEKLPEPTKNPDPKLKDIAHYVKKSATVAENKDDPEIKFNFSLDGTKTTKRYFTIDMELKPFKIHRLGLGGSYDFIPVYFKLNNSGDPKAEVDKMEFGFKFKHYRIFNDDGQRISDWVPENKIITGFNSEISPRIETDWGFEEVNAVIDWKSGIPLNLDQTRSRSLRITPYIGFEFGYKIRSEANTSKQKWISRPKLGADLYWSPYRTEEKTPLIFEAAYVRRLFLKPEIFYVHDENDKEIVGGSSKGTKDFFKGTVTLGLNKLISPFIEYTYGREPAKYILVDNRYRAGIKVSLDWKQ